MIRWLVNRLKSCADLHAELEARVSLAERQAQLCADEFRDQWRERIAWKETALSNGRHAESLERELAALRADFARRYRHVCELYRLQGEMLKEERQGRIEARAELETLQRKYEAVLAQLNAGGPVA